MKPIEQYMKFDLAFAYFNKHLFEEKLPLTFITLQSRGGAFGYFAPGRFRSVTDDDTKLDEIALNPDYFFYGELEIMQTLVHEMCHQWQHHYGKPSRSGYHNKQWALRMKAVGLIPSSTGRPGGKETGQKVADYVDEHGLFAKFVKKLLSAHTIIEWKYFSWESYRLQQIQCLSANQLQMTSTEGIKPGTYITVGHTTALVDKVDHDNNLIDYHQVSGQQTFEDHFQDSEGDLEAFIKVPSHTSVNRNKTKYICPNCSLCVWGKTDLKIVCYECDKMLETGSITG